MGAIVGPRSGEIRLWKCGHASVLTPICMIRRDIGKKEW